MVQETALYAQALMLTPEEKDGLVGNIAGLELNHYVHYFYIQY